MFLILTTWAWAEPTCDERHAAVQARIDDLRGRLGPSRPFPEPGPPPTTALAREVRRWGGRPLAIDCAEDPCLVAWTGRGHPPPAWASLSMGLRMRSTGERLEVSARLAAPEEASIVDADDPAAARRLAWRVNRLTAALRQDPLERALTLTTHAARSLREDNFGYAAQMQVRADALAALAARPLPPRAPDPCGAELDAAQAELLAWEIEVTGGPPPAPAAAEPGFDTETFAARMAASVAGCPDFRQHLARLECSEYPCVVVWYDGVPDLDACAPFNEVPRDRGITNQTRSFVAPDGAQVRLHGVIYWPATGPGPFAPGQERRWNRVQEAVRAERDARGLRPYDPLDHPENASPEGSAPDRR